ncbi:hypothetical protein SBRY_150038 [Actinacidiphila bryophytorum]|uniref:Uncharacterized protein n=1 Tax=Actinacidiphila bryophytorum TaxID=1436133 RepID=A0A9W4EDH3_9ACTN|nr:hypothetical protein SBRY_150038 [Actinacidiphila bryophytorum]
MPLAVRFHLSVHVGWARSSPHPFGGRHLRRAVAFPTVRAGRAVPRTPGGLPASPAVVVARAVPPPRFAWGTPAPPEGCPLRAG